MLNINGELSMVTISKWKESDFNLKSSASQFVIRKKITKIAGVNQVVLPIFLNPTLFWDSPILRFSAG